MVVCRLKNLKRKSNYMSKIKIPKTLTDHMNAPVHYCRLVINCARQLLAHLCSFFLSSVQSLTSSIGGHGDFYAHWQNFYYFSHSHHQLGNGCCQYVGRLFLVKTANSKTFVSLHTPRCEYNRISLSMIAKFSAGFEANLPYLKPNSYSRLSVDSIMNLSQV